MRISILDPGAVSSQNQIARAATLRNAESSCGRKVGVGRAECWRRFAQILTVALIWADADLGVSAWLAPARPADW